jgi:histidinol phosphatase-like PHP family hydrolase
MGTGRPMINMNPQKWITRGTVLIVRPGFWMQADYFNPGGLEEPEPIFEGKTHPTTIVGDPNTGEGLRIGGLMRFSQDAPLTRDVVGRYFAVDVPGEYVAQTPNMRRWYYIDGFKQNPDGTKEITVTRHELRLPQRLGLVDCHTHTPFAYCQENMDLALSLQLAEEFGLAGLAFTEHSGHLYFDAPAFNRGDYLTADLARIPDSTLRMPAYLAMAQNYCPPARLGLELDCTSTGQPVVRPEDRARVPFLIGAIHQLAELGKQQPDLDRAADEFLARLQTFVPSGIRILAHPFRVFRRARLPIPGHLFAPTVRLLREHGVAAEINFHTNEPSPVFTSLCIEAGVKLTFGSDAHNLYEIGEFFPHLDLLRRCGVTGNLYDVLSPLAFQPEGIISR